jgi:hypothetical protein
LRKNKAIGVAAAWFGNDDFKVKQCPAQKQTHLTDRAARPSQFFFR